MHANSILVVGVGGHSKVVSEIIRQNQQWEIAAYIDEGSSLCNFLGRQVITTLNEAREYFPTTKYAFVAIGSNEARKKWHALLQKNDYNIPSFIHPTAWVSDSALIEDGVLVCAKAIVGASCFVGEGTILNCSSVLDHDSQVGTFSHISPGTIVCGGGRIGSNSLIGPGSVIEKLAYVPDNTLLAPMTVIATTRQ
ncbi:acetyltransferase [Bdellovibrio bacteriovorus]|uniref:acetyltransferase n=1 Tax=Bdellovibrio bacteriovorus TaxID=959 RepID=UPI0035A969F8